MSMESARHFLEKLNSDDAFLSALANPAADRSSLLRDSGFDFTAGELAALVAGRLSKGLCLLKDETRSQREVVSGADGLESGP